MTELDRPDEPLLRRREMDDREWLLQAAQLVKAWEGPIERALTDLAQWRWPPTYLLGFIPLRSYRLRYQPVDPEIHLWWVEYESPNDRCNYQAYRVHFVLDAKNQPVLAVQSGDAVYPVIPVTERALIKTVRQAGRDSPLKIPRATEVAGRR